ncbi:c-type cytochrome [Acidithiobacillus sp. MC6.1]|nr:c-type cytochrome [Acidithiobacillus sp. MC6.1]
MLISKSIALAVTCLAVLIGCSAHDTDFKTEAQPNRGIGKVQAAMCMTCHGVEGLSVASNFPNLAGQHYKYLIGQLNAFKDGTRKNAVMYMMVHTKSQAELRNIAAYYAGIKITIEKSKSKQRHARN